MSRRHPWAIAGILPTVVATVLALAGCDYFRPADPEPPSGAAIIPDYSDPDATLRTMALAIADKARTNGASVYAGALAESTSTSTPGFHQFFWPSELTGWEFTSGRPAPADWNHALERNFYTRFIALNGEGYQMQWGPDDPNPDDPPGASPRTIHRQYVVTTESGDSIAIGYADLTFYQSQQAAWLITRWEDRPDPDHANPIDAEQQTLGLRRLGTQ